MSPDEVARREKAANQPMTAAKAEKMSARFKASVDQQRAFQQMVGLDSLFFAWIPRFNKLPEADRLRMCHQTTSNPTFLIFAPEVLAQEGYSISAYKGPDSVSGLRDVLTSYGLPAGTACYIAPDDVKLLKKESGKKQE